MCAHIIRLHAPPFTGRDIMYLHYPLTSNSSDVQVVPRKFDLHFKSAWWGRISKQLQITRKVLLRGEEQEMNTFKKRARLSLNGYLAVK